MILEIKHGDWIERLKEMPAESVHCVVTSPPYWGLRDYGAVGQLGLEKTPEDYISKMVEGFREVRRVLRKDGTLWLNMGDCYAQGSKGNSGEIRPGDKQGTNAGSLATRRGAGIGPNRIGGTNGTCKPKDVVGMPWMLAFALRADGWWLRQDIIWAKDNPMPESVTDRCTKAHEYLFLLAKSSRYYFDSEAIKEPVSGTAHPRGDGVNPKAAGPKDDSRDDQGLKVSTRFGRGAGFRVKQNASFSAAVNELVSSRNKRSVWEIATSPFPEAHFATFPPKLVEPCILAGTSEKGCCPKCGAPWERIVESDPDYANVPKACAEDQGSNRTLISGYQRQEYTGKHAEAAKQAAGRRILKAVKEARDNGGDHDNPFPPKRTTGWLPSCDCWSEDPIPCTVLDPFAGAGTTGLVALRYHRNFIGIELKAEYCEMARRRIEQDAPLFNTREIFSFPEGQ